MTAAEDHNVSWDTQRTVMAVWGPVLALLEMTHCFFHERLSPPHSVHMCMEHAALQRAVIAQKQEVHSPESDLDLRGEKQ